MSISFYPTQAAGPQATDQPLPDYLSYSAYQTNVETVTVTRIGVVYGGDAAPSQTVVVSEEVRTQVAYSVVNLPLTYDGPLPPPPLGTGWVLPGQDTATSGSQGSTNSQGSTATATSGSQGATTETNNSSATESNSQSNSQGETATATGSDGETATSQSATQSATQPTNSNESSNVNSVSQTGTGNTNSATNSNPQNSNSASTASNPISTSNSNSATTSSQPSSTSSLPSSTSSGTSSSSSLQPTNSNGVPITPNQLNASGLSDGQIAGIVVGSVLGFLLLLLLVLLCIRRKRRNEEAAAAGMAGMGSRKRQISDKWASGFSTGGASKGNYAALGAAGAGAAAGVAAGASRSRGSLRSDEWEEDHLTGGGGSGFFVVGGKKQERNANDPTSSPTGSYGRRSSRGHIYGNIGRGSPSAQNGSGGKKKGLGSALGIGAGAGLLAAALGRSKSSKRSNNQSSPTQDQDPFSDDYDADPDLDHEEPEMTERRGLMNNFATDGPGAVGGEDGELYGGDDSEMRNAGHSGWGGGAAGALGAGALAGAALASSNKRSGHSEMEERDISGMTPSHSGSSAGVGVGAFNATRPSTRESHSRTASSHRPTSSAGGGYTSGTNSNSGRSGTAGQSHAGSGSGSGSGSATISGGGVSSASTGGRTQESPIIGASLPPPPRAPRERQAHVFGNLAPSKEGAAATLPGFQEGFGSGELGLGEPRVSSDTFDTDSSGRTRDVPNLGNAALAAGAGAAGGLGLLAAQHRDSAGSTYSKGFYPSGVPSGYGSSTDQLSEEDRAAGKRPRHSQFLSHNTNLLGPDAHTPGQTDSETDEPTPLGGSHSHSRDRSGAQVYGNLGPPSTGYAQHGRLSTIRSVGEFGERSQSSEAFSGSNSGSGSASIRGSGLGGNGSRTPGGLDEFASQYYQTGTSSPRGTMGEPRGARSFVSGTGSGASRRGGSRMRVSSSFSRERDGEGDEEDDDRSQSDAETGNGVRSSEDVQDIPDEESENLHRNVENAAASAAVGAGFFGGMAAGWHRLTMNPQTWLSGGNSSSNQTETQPLASTQEGNDQDDGAVEQFQTARHEAPTASDPGLAPDARSEHATIYRASTLGHGGSGGQNSPAAVNSSREGSGGSGSVPNEGLLLAAGSGLGSRHSPAPRSIGTSHSSSSRRGGDGYAASVSNASGSGGSMSRRSASENASIMTGLESLSQHPQASSSGASGSLSSGSRRSHGTGRGASDSGASTGAASYSPSHLARGSSSSTRGSGRLAGSGSGSGSGSFASSSRAAYAAGRQKSALGEADYENGDWDSDAQSSNATAGGSLASHEPNRPSSSSNKKKRPRSNSAEAGGNRRLSSVADLPGQEDEEEEAQLLRNLPLGGQGHFPSPSLGAAMLRQANRDAATSSGGSNHGRQGSGSGTEPNPTTPRALPKSLLPGPVPPLPPTLHTSTSSPSLGDANVPPPAIHSQEGSGSWRQSPRVASASQRASAAAAHLEASRAATLSPSKGGTLPRSGAQPRSTSEEFAWGGLGASSTSPPSSPRTRSRLRNLQKEAEQGEAGLNEEVAENEQQGGGGFLTEWPKFLRF